MTYLFAALAALLFLIVLRIGKEIFLSYQCPDEQSLKDFWNGRLRKGDSEYRRVVTHLGVCEKCRDKLDQIQKGKPLEDHLVDD
jgi:hypothetical protein